MSNEIQKKGGGFISLSEVVEEYKKKNKDKIYTFHSFHKSKNGTFEFGEYQETEDAEFEVIQPKQITPNE